MSAALQKLIVAFAAVLAFAPAARAQTYHMMETPEKGVWMEASYADLEGLDQSFPSTFWFASGRMPLTSGFSVVADVPFAFSRLKFGGTANEGNAVVGNPFLGLEYRYGGLLAEGGLRLPLNSIDSETFADVIGVLGDFQRSEAFLDQVVPLSGAVSYEYGLPGGASIRGRTGVVGLFYTDDEFDNDALIDYGVLGTYPAGPARFGLGFYGRWIATEDVGGFNDNSVHHVAVSGDVLVRGLRPGIAVRFPVDETYWDVLHTTVGVYLQVPLR